MNNNFSRREFVQIVSAATVAGVIAPAWAAGPSASRGPVCLFSKSVPQLGWQELAKAAKQAGFDGIDLTVRAEGHVLPERAATDLPKAVEAIRAEGMQVPMLTTELLSADDPTARPIFETAGKLTIPYIKPGYYAYQFINPLKEVHEAGRQFRSLVVLAKQNGIQVGYHNHPNYIGSSVWDMANVIEALDPRWCGYYFDLGHISVNEGEDEWNVATRLVMPRLKMLAVKDMTWERGGDRGWRAVACPMGKGMAPWKGFLQILATSDFHGPISLHQANVIPDVADEQGIALSRAAVPQVMAAAKENLDYLKSLLRETHEHA